MREIKFRGKDKIGNKGWVFGDLVHNLKVTQIGLEPRIMVAGYEVDQETVGQYTGLSDKDGKEIYEGDILQADTESHITYAVAWHQDGYFFFNTKSCLNVFFRKGLRPLGEALTDVFINGKRIKFEIIGNIYDNPELLNR